MNVKEVLTSDKTKLMQAHASIKIHNKTKNLDWNHCPKNLMKQTKRWSLMEISLNDLVFSELDQNKVGNIVLKYIIYENSLRGNISNIWPS